MAEKNNFKDLTGKVFGKWTVIRRVLKDSGAHHSTIYLCKCVCGVERERFRTNLIHGKNVGCGCIPWVPKLRPYESLYNIFVREAVRSERFDKLSYEDFLGYVRVRECHNCDGQIKWAESNPNTNGNSYNLDRKNNDIGYHKENCVVCCGRCNRAKSKYFTYEEWVEIGKTIRRLNEEKSTASKST